MSKLNKVCVNIDQTDPNNGGFTDSEKAQARANIGATGASDLPVIKMPSDVCVPTMFSSI